MSYSVTTVAELKEAIKDLPDDMPVRKWDGCESIMYSGVNDSTTTVYDDGVNETIYGGYDDENHPSREMLVF